MRIKVFFRGIILFISFFSAGISLADAPSTQDEFKSSFCKFSCKLPQDFKVSTDSCKTDGTIVLRNQDNAVAINFSQVGPGGTIEMLNSVANAQLSTIIGKGILDVPHGRRIVDGVDGIWFMYSKDSSRHCQVYFLKNNNLYQIHFVFGKGAIDAAFVDNFLINFKATD